MEADEVVTSKPVASRLTRTRFSTFSELLAGAMGPCPSSTCTTIRPKAVRFKPSRTPVGAVPFQVEATGASTYGSYDGVLNSDHRSANVYKPVTKIPSRRTISLLANLGEPRSSHQQTIAAQVEDHIQHENQDKHHFGTRLASKLCRSHLTEKNRTPELSEMATENLEGDDKRPLPPSISIQRPPYDGYNWRKYGQKRVKGSEYPRSYYTCTHPSCPVKKKVERSLDHQIAEIVYKGEHNHSKPPPQPPKNDSSGSQGQGFASDGTGQYQNSTSRNNNRMEKNGSSETRVANQVEVGSSSHSTYTEKTPLFNNPFKTGAINAASDSTCRLSGESETVSKKVDDEEPRSKRRRRRKSQSNVAAESEEGAQETPIIVQNSTDAKTFGDGFRWRKYGQKVVKGNPYPRSYYRCTALKCNARKHVEGSSDDPDTFITTYEGRHNHDMPRRVTKAGTF